MNIPEDNEFSDLIAARSHAVNYLREIRGNGDYLHVSSNVSELFGYRAEEAMQPGFWQERIHPEDRADVVEAGNQISSNHPVDMIYRIRHQDYRYIPVLDKQKAVTTKNKIELVIGAWIDVSKYYQKGGLTDQVSFIDKLTGLPHRRELSLKLSEMERMQFHDDEHVFCYLDLDQFKIINNTYGYDAGDEFIRQYSVYLQQHLAATRQRLFRLDGDEFGILLEHCNQQESESTLDLIQETFKEFRLLWGNKSLAVTGSIGAVEFGKRSDTNPNQIIRMANIACHTAKEAGRNKVKFFREEGDNTPASKLKEQMRFVEEINLGMEEDRFTLYYQPVKNLHLKRDFGHYEILLRMHGTDGSLIPPGRFMPVAERFNLQQKIDKWVIQTMFSWLDAYSDILVEGRRWGINLSGQSLASKKMLGFVLDEIERKDINPAWLYFEVTETAVVGNFDNAVNFMKSLRAIGCKIALDDFGTGLSSFAYLKTFPIDYIKIDGFFVKQITSSLIDYGIVKAIQDVARTMDIKVVAEHVETPEIYEILRKMGIDYGQGYGIQKPESLTRFMASINQLA